ncbi:kynureninase [Rhizobium sp. KVB221]|uniref:Kynureninase n=2 Tax=Rhizobium setariae TaxID=2801340 RepID=A0A936YMZ6_9HYPH|nr:kynureninase [Rhizobium setariae]
MTRADVQALDREDLFAPLRNAFEIPEGVIYLDGNSLGPMQGATRRHVADVVSQQWGEGLIRSWNTHDWIDLPTKIAGKIEGLIGVPKGTVAVCDSTSINLFKVLAAALHARPSRRVILSERNNFPTDLHIAQGLIDLLADGYELRTVATDELADAINDEVAVVLLTEVNYRTGRRLDMAELTRLAHAGGALTIWDLAHSAGAFKVELAAANVDFAVGCGYKFLNGGPGAPAFAYVAPQHIKDLRQPITGWFGHATPFNFVDDYAPAPSIERMRVGTPPILSLAALDSALDIFDGVDMLALRAKADRLFEIFSSVVVPECPELELVTPLAPNQRGSQIAFRFEEAYAGVQALIAQNVIGDFRTPDIMRFGLTPLYLSHEDVWQAAHVLVKVMRDRLWDQPAYRVRAKVV